MLDFFRTVWEINQKCRTQRLRIMIVDMARPWKEIKQREDWRKYDVDSDQFMAENIVRIWMNMPQISGTRCSSSAMATRW